MSAEVQIKGIKIFVLDRAHVLIADVELCKELVFHWKFIKAKTIRNWGTSKGLTELCEGPTDKTVLDMSASEIIPFRAVLRIIDVNEEKWKKHLYDGQ